MAKQRLRYACCQIMVAKYVCASVWQIRFQIMLAKTFA